MKKKNAPYKPGPWKAINLNWGMRIIPDIHPDEHRPRPVIAALGDDPQGPHRSPECLADATLIAAAPDLLVACREALIQMVALGKKLNWDDTVPLEYARAINGIRAAVARAQGE